MKTLHFPGCAALSMVECKRLCVCVGGGGVRFASSVNVDDGGGSSSNVRTLSINVRTLGEVWQIIIMRIGNAPNLQYEALSVYINMTDNPKKAHINKQQRPLHSNSEP